MRCLAICVGLGLLASCTPDPDVVAEQRTAIAAAGFDDDTRVTAPPVEPPATTATTIPATPALTPTSPPSTGSGDPGSIDPRSATLLLVAGDVAGWTIDGPRTIGPGSYGVSSCRELDVVRDYDSFTRLQTHGRSTAADFHNMVIETGSDEHADAIMAAVSTAPQVCPEFTDGRGTGWLERLEVPDGGWEAAGLAVAAGGQPALLGFWRKGRTIVKLRVLDDGDEAFALLADAVARKLATGADPDEPAPESTVAHEDDWYDWDGSDEGWETHPLASMILTADEVDRVGLDGGPWYGFGVTIDEPGPGTGELFCGVEIPAQGDGLSTTLLGEQESIVSQSVMLADPALAQEWIDIFAVLVSCGFSDDGPLRTTYEPVSIGVERVPGADEIAAVRAELFDAGGASGATSLAAIVRVGDVIVQVVVSTYLADDRSAGAVVDPDVDDVVRLLQMSLD